MNGGEDESKGLAEILDILRRGRKYANFFESTDKASKEWYIGLLLLARRESQLGDVDPWTDLQPCEHDPPDLSCAANDGTRIAIELTEIVCRRAVRKTQRGDAVYRVWTPAEIRDAIDSALTSKDQKQFVGGPWSRICVCLFSDEMMITPDAVNAALATGPLGPFRQISHAYMLLSYQAGEYPLIAIPLNADDAPPAHSPDR